MPTSKVSISLKHLSNVRLARVKSKRFATYILQMCGGGPSLTHDSESCVWGGMTGKSNVLLGTEELDYTTQGLGFTAQAGKTNYFKVGVSLKNLLQK